ncbi:MAG: UDP-N-acetylmuramoyl-L-alanyl-D-glutamate--2,6-diaminopimelate ligase [Pseudomonadota bacterium]
MLLSELLNSSFLNEYKELFADIADFEIANITADSRKVKDNYIFVAIKGNMFDGNDYINTALNNGAKLIITAQNIDNIISNSHNNDNNIDEIANNNIDTKKIIQIDDDRLFYSKLAAAFYQDKPENIISVTGTNGKTSIVNFCTKLWGLTGKQTASIGTIGIIENGKNITASNNLLTTPDPMDLHQYLANLKQDNIENVALEASSHGLSQKRLSSLKFKAAAFTNISRDHLDYHKNFAAYFAAKMLLFQENIAENGTAVLNADIKEYEEIKNICLANNTKIFSYGKNGRDLKILSISPKPMGQLITFESKGNITHKILLPLIGEFQVYNILCALGLLVACGENIDILVGKLTSIKPVTGRMDKAALLHNNATIYVDYAHTPDALKNALIALKNHSSKNLHVLFGCGGDRDNGKRPLMGEIAMNYADNIIVTDDNPRSEDPAKIRQEIMASCSSSKAINVGDRREAIKQAICMLEKNDILLIAGKGHEDYQIINNVKQPFDDKLVVQELIASIYPNKKTIIC